MDEVNANGTEEKKGALGPVLLILSILAVGLVAYDAATAHAATARSSAPQFLFLFILPGLFRESSRFVTLGAQLALPGLAVILPLAALGMGLARRRVVVAVLAGIFLVAGLGANVVLYGALGAVPDDDPAPPVAANSASAAASEKEDPKNNEAGSASKEPVETTRKKGVEKIVFASDRDGKYHLWMMNPDGSGQEKISKTDRIHMQPRFSPDGTRAVFTTASADGKHMAAVFDWKTREEKDICEGSQAAFADGGKSIVFRRSGQIYHRSLESGEEKMLSPKMWSKCSFPSASSDGKSVALASRLLAGYNIYIVPAAGGEPKVLVGGQGTCDPRWSPSGTRLSYQTETNIYTIKPDGTDKFQATFGGGVQHYATWAPDEKKIAYCQGPGPNGPWQIYVVSLVEDEDPVKLTKEGSNIYPDWGVVERER